jgi:hypothetical protein
MFRYEFINKEWLVSRAARAVYRTASCLSLVLVILVVAVELDYALLVAFRPFLRLAVLVGALGAATSLVGMEFFLVRFDDSRPFTQIFWFFAMVLTAPIGPALYCFLVYSRSTVVRSACAVSARSSPPSF